MYNIHYTTYVNAWMTNQVWCSMEWAVESVTVIDMKMVGKYLFPWADD